MMSDPTFNKGDEKPMGAAYPIAAEPISSSLYSSWSQLFPDNGSRIAVNLAYVRGPKLQGFESGPGALYIADLKTKQKPV